MQRFIVEYLPTVYFAEMGFYGKKHCMKKIFVVEGKSIPQYQKDSLTPTVYNGVTGKHTCPMEITSMTKNVHYGHFYLTCFFQRSW